MLGWLSLARAPSLLHESRPHEFVAAVTCAEDLDGDPSPQALILGEENPGHPARPDLAEDPVAGESLRHRFPRNFIFSRRLFTGNQVKRRQGPDGGAEVGLQFGETAAEGICVD